MTNNPSEVVILEFQMHGTEAGWTWWLNDEMYSAGLGDMMHVHRNGFASDWALMKDLVKRNERLLIFHHNGPHCWPLSKCPDGFHMFHWYAIETPHSIKRVDAMLNDKNQSCSVAAGYEMTASFLVVNHFANSAVGLPQIRNARQLNRRDVLNERIALCTNILGMRPNMVAVDFWSEGNLPAVTQEQNRLVAAELLGEPTDI